MKENQEKKTVNAAGMPTPEVSTPRPPNSIKVIPIDSEDKTPFYQPVSNNYLAAQFRGQLCQAETEIRRLQAELDKYRASGRIVDTSYKICCDPNPEGEADVYRIHSNDEFTNIRDELIFFEGWLRSLLNKRIGTEYLNELTAHLAQGCFAVSREEAIAKLNRTGEATDSVTAGIRTIRELIGMLGHEVAKITPKYPAPGEYAARIRQLASSMKLEEPEIFLICFPDELLADARVYRELRAHQQFANRLSRFQLDFQFACSVCCDYPPILEKPVGYLLDFMSDVQTGNNIAGAVKVFREGISAAAMNHAPARKIEKPLDDRACDVLEFCIANGAAEVSAKAMREHIKETSKSRFRKTVLLPLCERGLLEFVCADAHSSKQSYRITPLGVSVLKESRPGRTYSEPSHTDSEAAPTVSELESSEPDSTGTTDSAARNSRV